MTDRMTSDLAPPAPPYCCLIKLVYTCVYCQTVIQPRPTPVRSRLIARQQSQSSPDPAGKDSATSSPILTEDGTSVRLSFQSCSLLLLADESSGVTVRMKLFRDFNLLAAGW